MAVSIKPNARARILQFLQHSVSFKFLTVLREPLCYIELERELQDSNKFPL